MRLEKLRQVDLNLLITFAVIAEEKSVTAAASRLFLSQPAVSRALQRARAMFQDDLLVRSPQGFELTLRGRKVLQELEELLPRVENLVTPSLFDPMREKSHFRISGPDNVCTVVLPRLCRRYANGHYQVQFEFLPWQSGIAESTAIRATCGCARQCDQQLRLSMSNPVGSKISFKGFYSVGSRTYCNLLTRTGTQCSAIHMAIHNDPRSTILPMPLRIASFVAGLSCITCAAFGSLRVSCKSL